MIESKGQENVLTMLVGDHFPKLGSNLVAALSSLDMNDFTHCLVIGGRGRLLEAKYKNIFVERAGFFAGFALLFYSGCGWKGNFKIQIRKNWRQIQTACPSPTDAGAVARPLPVPAITRSLAT